jgi:hypothetical protein
MFKLTQTEWDYLRSQFATTNKNNSKVRFLPYAFTEHGVSMLSNNNTPSHRNVYQKSPVDARQAAGVRDGKTIFAAPRRGDLEEGSGANSSAKVFSNPHAGSLPCLCD